MHRTRTAQTALTLVACLWALPPQSIAREDPGTEAEGPKVEVVDAGSGEKRELRYELEAGAKTSTRMTIDMAMRQSMNGQDLPQQIMPIMVVDVDTTVGASEGDVYAMTSSVRAIEVKSRGGVDPMAVNQMRQQLAAVKGTDFSWKMSRTGAVSGLEADASNPMAQQVRNAIENSVVRLPDEPVGAGAAWRIEQGIDGLGMSIDQVVNYTLKSREGKRLVIEARLKQSAKEQEVESAQLPPGATLKVVSMTGEGDGTLTVALNEPAAVKVTLNSSIDASFDMVTGGQKIAMDQRMKLRTEVERRNAGTAERDLD